MATFSPQFLRVSPSAFSAVIVKQWAHMLLLPLFRLHPACQQFQKAVVFPVADTLLRASLVDVFYHIVQQLFRFHDFTRFDPFIMIIYSGIFPAPVP